jgi:hypothetical protein
VKVFRDVDPDTFADLQKFISAGEKRTGPDDVPLTDDERRSLLLASANLFVTGTCGCGDKECKTYQFVDTEEQGRAIQFEAGYGIAILFVRSGSEILSFERILNCSKMLRADDDVP